MTRHERNAAWTALLPGLKAVANCEGNVDPRRMATVSYALGRLSIYDGDAEDLQAALMAGDWTQFRTIVGQRG